MCFIVFPTLDLTSDFYRVILIKEESEVVSRLSDCSYRRPVLAEESQLHPSC